MMKQLPDEKGCYSLPIRTIFCLVIVIVTIGIVSSAFESKKDLAIHHAALEDINKDSVESVKAFMSVYKVLMSPRCMNCHPAGDVPLQGEDSHLHTMLPQRGQDGKGVYAMKCANCHQAANTLGLHTPPGNPNWHLPPADMKMVFQGRTAHQLAKQLSDPARNGHKTKAQLIEHADDTLVLAGWHPGEGRSLPPMSHEDFKKAWITWINKGAYAPKP